MRRAALLIALAACGPNVPPPTLAQPLVPRLLAPQQIEPDARGAAYLTAVALSLQPAWHQFLEDCRLRLPASHALNRMQLVTTVELDIGRRGELVELRIAKSGTPDFDHAIEQVVRDASPLPPPPRELWSDDDRVHLTWLFARDRRQAGPATARVIDVELPLRGVVDRRIGEHDLARAARRILREKPSNERELATQRLMIAALREGLASSDGTVRRAAVDAIARARASELAMDVRQLLTNANDIELRLAATRASAALRDTDASPIIVDNLRFDLRDQPRVALAGVRALVELGREADVKPLLAAQLGSPPNPVALQALADAPISDLAPKLTTWFRTGSARTRAAVCGALAGYPQSLAAPLLDRGMRDRDATVRALCTQRGAKLLPELARDRDSTVRAAYAAATSSADELHVLIEDRDPDVRAAAWTTLATLGATQQRARLARAAAADPAAQVRLAAISAIEDGEILGKLARSDDDRAVRSAALVRLAEQAGRAASADMLLERLVEAAPGSVGRVRTALAWLLAR
jgi:TonB family protein